MTVVRSISKTAFAAALILVTSTAYPNGIRNTKHNLGLGGDPAMAQICVFCHAPHNGNPSTPLWNRELPVLVYTPYSSSTMQSSPGQPTHASKMCLSCHDGTIGLGHVLNEDLPLRAGGTIKGRANLTTDLSDDHPVSFVYDSSLAAQDTELADPAVVSASGLTLDDHSQMQCTTCHDPHFAPNPFFLRLDGRYSRLCTVCHKKDRWQGSSHANSPAQWNGAGLDPWPHTEWSSVAANGCENCHSPHTAGMPERLLNYPNEEDNCLSCHNGNVATKDIEADVRKPFAHAVDDYLDAHDPTEAAHTMPRHVECEDCHNPHAATSAPAFAPNASGALANVPGVTISGAPTIAVQFEYEVCFRCHADAIGVPTPKIRRQIHHPNIRLKFQANNPSSHPVVGPGNNMDVPSLITPWNERSVMYCSDCHASDSGPGANGAGAAGPHGSVWQFLLEREYRVADNTNETYQAYAMCYKCHDRMSILSDRSFSEHSEHTVNQRIPCSACHDPHGISSTQGNMVNNTHLMNFDISIVSADPVTGRLEFRDMGQSAGECYLSCHGKAHSPEVYGTLSEPQAKKTRTPRSSFRSIGTLPGQRRIIQEGIPNRWNLPGRTPRSGSR